MSRYSLARLGAVATAVCVIFACVHFLEREALPMLEKPTARQIQTRTEPPYGYSSGVVPGEMMPVSPGTARGVGLADGWGLNRDYALVQNMYRAILVPRLVRSLGLAEFDQELADFGIPAVTDPDKQPFDLYAQQAVGVNLSYLTIRNNLYVERLSRDQIKLFLDHANDPGFATDPELTQIVLDTYPRIIRLIDRDGTLNTGYDMTGNRFPNNAITINLVYGETDNESDDEGRYNQLHEQRVEFLYRGSFVPDLEAHLADSWSGNTKLFITRISLISR